MSTNWGNLAGNAVKHLVWPISPEIGVVLEAPAVWRPQPRQQRRIRPLEDALQRCLAGTPTTAGSGQ